MAGWENTRDLLDEWVGLTSMVGTDDPGEVLDEDDFARLAVLQDLVDTLGETAMRDGEMMVPDDEFVDYARQLAEDIGAFDERQGWPLCHIDWEAAADSLRTDYTSVEFDGRSYLVRA